MQVTSSWSVFFQQNLGSIPPDLVRKANNLTIILCVVMKSGTLTSWNPLGHSRPVTGLLTVRSNDT